MKLHTFGRRSAAAAAVLALSMTLAACGDDADEPSNNSAENSSNTDDQAADPQAQTFGAGCSEIPTEGDGSFVGMASDPVGTAAGTNPLLTTLVAAVGATELGDTLNAAEALTVFAPYDPAFGELGDAVTDLVNGVEEADSPQTSPLAQILTHHVLGSNNDPAAVAGEQDTLNGDTLTIEGDESGMTVSDGTVTATVICGNIPTANATVYVIDKVLLGADVK
ncbi:MAG: fasciclin domain-containing protein [Nocardioides sp.]